MFASQPAVYQPNPKELHHSSQHSSAVNHRWTSRRAGVWSRSESHHPDPLEKGVLCPFFDPRHAARAWGEKTGRMRRWDPRWRVYKAWPAAKQPHQERMSRACKVVGGARGCVPRGANGKMLCTSSRSGVQEMMRRRDPRWRVYEAWPAAKQPRQKRMSRARKGGGRCARVFATGVQESAPWGKNVR